MKKLFIISAIAAGGLMFNTANAQVGIHVGLNLGAVHLAYTSAPAVVEQYPVYNEDADDYYYLPDVDAYYDVADQCYVYFDGNEWIPAAYLPGAYHNYDWRSARYVEVRGRRPFMRDDFYRSRYHGEAMAWNRERDHDGGYYRHDDRAARYGDDYRRNENAWGDRYREQSDGDHWHNGEHNDGRYNNQNGFGRGEHRAFGGNFNQGRHEVQSYRRGDHDGF